MKTLYLIRHGQTVWNTERRMQGRLDSPLTKFGGEQAHENGRLLKSLGRIDALYVSPSGRTRETAYIINSYIRAPIDYEDALLERDVGEWSGLTLDEIEQQYPQAWRSRLEDPFRHRPPEGENLVDMGMRCQEFVDDLLASPNPVIALVTHQVMSRIIISRLLELSPEETMRVVHPNDLVYRLTVQPEQIETAHFVGGNGPVAGLLHQTDSETIPHLNQQDRDTCD